MARKNKKPVARPHESMLKSAWKSARNAFICCIGLPAVLGLTVPLVSSDALAPTVKSPVHGKGSVTGKPVASVTSVTDARIAEAIKNLEERRTYVPKTKFPGHNR